MGAPAAFCAPAGRGLALRGGAPVALATARRHARVAAAPGARCAPRMDAAGTDFDDVARRLAEELGAPAADAGDKAEGANTENVSVGPGNGGLMRVSMKHAASNQVRDDEHVGGSGVDSLDAQSSVGRDAGWGRVPGRTCT